MSSMRWASPTQSWRGNLNACRKVGVTSLEVYGTYGPSPNSLPWNARTMFPAFIDGSSNTLLPRQESESYELDAPASE
jgi:hypothetical protein